MKKKNDPKAQERHLPLVVEPTVFDIYSGCPN